MRYYEVYYSYDVGRLVPRKDGLGCDLLVYGRGENYVIIHANNKAKAKEKAENWLGSQKVLYPTVTGVYVVTKGY